MRKLIIAVSQDGRQTTELCFRFEPELGEDPFDSLRAAVFLTGVTVESAKVIESHHEWIAPPPSAENAEQWGSSETAKVWSRC
jgi:hypothetical protein